MSIPPNSVYLGKIGSFKIPEPSAPEYRPSFVGWMRLHGESGKWIQSGHCGKAMSSSLEYCAPINSPIAILNGLAPHQEEDSGEIALKDLVNVCARNTAMDLKPLSTKAPDEKPDTPDLVNRPAHYTGGRIECIDALEAATEGLQGAEAGLTWSVMKYMWRWKRKDCSQDLKKARWYLERLIKQVDDI